MLPPALDVAVGLTPGWAAAAKRDAAAHFARSRRSRAQEGFAFDLTVLDDERVRATLLAQFGGKCAYCETPLAPNSALVDRFRPPSGALDLEGNASADHYWWLAYEPDNLLPCCAPCQSFKGNKFPVRSRRVAPQATGDALLREKALLLDPRRDNPEDHLIFTEDGAVSSETPEGRASIECLSLNRAQLVTDRADAIAQARTEWSELTAKGSGPPSPSDLEALFAVARPFAAARRQIVLRLAETHAKRALQAPEVAEAVKGVRSVSAAQRRRVKSEFDERSTRPDQVTVTQDNAAPGYFAQTRRIERLVVKNFKVIADLDLTLPHVASSQGNAPWVMLLGENGCGKSSLLQAIALALMGRARNELGLDATTFVRNGTRRGRVEVHFAGAQAPEVATFSRSSPRFDGGDDQRMLLLAYGATRLLPRRGQDAAVPDAVVRVDNMFDPFSPIGNATGWALSLDQRRFDALARALKNLMSLEPEDRILRNRRAGRIEAQAFGQRVPLEHLSDGYQSVIALATDIMAVLLRLWPNPESAEGIVLIVGSSRVDLQACKLEYSIVSPK